ncbi:hypothetical protein GCM10023156_30630 [Novipirellula rosea]|uniref:Uncharacterized protein n=1 Tax=Novipirellula rosea TaxID=1031540 RepID=A0ABP8MTR0_9BACT
MLDYGCGDGAFLTRAKNAGWDVIGTDLDSVCVENGIAKGLDIRLGGTELLSSFDQSFDAVTCSHVIEHVPDPSDVISHFFRILRPGGRLFIDTPNINAFGHQIYGRHWRGLEAPRHLTIFNWKSLESMITRAGFISVKRRVRDDVFGGMMAKSELITAGHDCEDPSAIARCRKPSLLRRLAQRLSYHSSEFVTLTARKPELSDA